MTNPLDIGAVPRPALYHGWFVVAAAFLIAFFGFGFGFYGPGVYLVALSVRHGWPVAALVPAITAYYMLGAILLFFWVGPLFDRCGARRVVSGGVAAMTVGLVLLTEITQQWQVYAAFAIMAIGWATMSGAAINIIVAPWFDKRRGLAVSWSLNGANAGGILVVPLLTFVAARLGFAAALQAAAVVMVAVLIPVVVLVLRPKEAGERDPADRDDGLSANFAEPKAAPLTLQPVIRSARFLTISVPFALALMAQVGLLTHQLAYLSPLLGGGLAAGWAVSLTAFAAVAGRAITGLFVDKLDRRMTACGNFLMQAAGVAVLASASTAPMLYAGCFMFGLGVGNATSLPGLIVHQEFPNRLFSQVVSLVVAVNQFTFAFGPSLLGYLRQATGHYTAALVACFVLEVAAAAIVILPVLARSARTRSLFGRRHTGS